MADNLKGLLQAWMGVEKARGDYVAGYFSAGWVHSGEVVGPAKPLDKAALEGFKDHDRAVAETRQALEHAPSPGVT